MCGEKHGGNSATQRAPGSPPRVRGEARKVHAPMLAGRITPACAGRRIPFLTLNFRGKDHPRVCGEKSFCVIPKSAILGSPPRVRGEEQKKSVTQRKKRITPACAGRSLLRAVAVSVREDHPRVCGEKVSYELKSGAVHGSPPRVRGEVASERLRRVGVGITPACAGRRVAERCDYRCSQDHPRVCGEKTFKLGSVEALSRITPACAGRSSEAGFVDCRKRDHPRVCGEKFRA